MEHVVFSAVLISSFHHHDEIIDDIYDLLEDIETIAPAGAMIEIVVINDEGSDMLDLKLRQAQMSIPELKVVHCTDSNREQHRFAPRFSTHSFDLCSAE